MIQICARPTAEPVVKGEGVYSIEFKLGAAEYVPLMKVRAKNGTSAEDKLFFVFRHELSGKFLDFDIERFRKNEQEDSEEAVASSGAEGSRSEGPGEGDEGQ